MNQRPPTRLEYALLGLLHQQPQSGYDLRKVFATTALGNYSSSPGAIYPALKRLETKALVGSEIDDARALRPRKVYRPTPDGSAVFRAWLVQDISTDDVARGFDELMLRFAFHWVLDAPAASYEFLHTLADLLGRYTKELEAQRRMFPPEAPVQSRLALDAGIEQYRAAARWARKSRKHFKEDT
ncbi:MAG: PadR family transcriptional regulator [Acidobacteriota bacterium]|nr:PadR family transcriptional regulator [Acidobacteriota bacterium]